MDVHCTTCGEPWDVDHLRFEAIYETGASEPEAEAWHALPSDQKLNARYRQALRAAGWEFGHNVINVVIRCPCCPRTPNLTSTASTPRPPWSKCWAMTKTAWPPRLRIINYEHRKSDATDASFPNAPRHE